MFNLKSFKRGLLGCALLCGLLLSHSGLALANTTSSYYDLTLWQNAVNNVELFETTSGNIALADEVSSAPGDHTDVGSILNFQAASTGLSRGFSVATLQSGSSFIFNEVSIPSYQNALSVGLDGAYENDDWSLSLLDNASMNAFGIVIRDTRAGTLNEGEYVQLYFNNVLMDTVDLSSAFPAQVDENVFIGFTTDYAFDRIDFNEEPDSDDIAIADFRFATASGPGPAVAPEPASTALFLSGLSTLGVFRWRYRKN